MQPGKNRYNTRDAMVISIQPRDKLGNKRSKNNKIPTIV